MTEKDVHKCLISTGFYPMTIILQILEKENRFEECVFILESMNSYREKYKIVADEIPTQWSEEFRNQHYRFFKNADKSLIDNSVDYYVKDIKNRLKLK